MDCEAFCDNHAQELTSSPSLTCAKVRVLSYNFNILPRFCGGYQHERIDTFLTCVDSYDVLLLQEVYATSLFPYALQRRLCFKKILLDGLKEKGFVHYVIPRQPSYSTMMQHSVTSDNGLLIASRYPIWHRGSYTFRNPERAPSEMSKGCLFAEVEVPTREGDGGHGSARVIFFNVHLRPEERTPLDSSQVQQMRQFVESVLSQLHYTPDGKAPSAQPCPFVVAGDFNIHGIETNTTQTSKKLTDFLNEMQPLGSLHDALTDECGFNPPTRPPKLFFPALSKLQRYEAGPQRQDYFLITDAVSAADTKLEKFVVSRRRPYTYLSDHFGISTTLSVETNVQPIQRSSSRLYVSSMIETAHHEESNPTSGFRTEAFLLLFVSWLALKVSVKPLVLFALVWLIVRYSSHTIGRLPARECAVEVTSGVLDGSEEVDYHLKGHTPLGGVRTVGEMWERSVTRFRTLRCLGTTGDTGEAEWLSYGAVDVRVRELGAGLTQLGVAPGDLIGVECEACRSAALLELACAMYGFVVVPLAGGSGTMRTLLDQYHIRIAFADSGSVARLLSCRSTSLETIVYIHTIVDEADIATAKDLNIALITVESLEYNGRQLQFSAPSQQLPNRITDGSAILTYTLDNVSSDSGTTLIPLTHADVLRDINTLMLTGILPCCFTNDSMVWFTRFASLFHRICVLGLLLHGNAVAATNATHLQHAFTVFHPTVLVTSPSLFSTSSLQVSRAKQRYGALYNWLFDLSFQLRSRLIHVSNKDSALLRFLFFRSFQAQLGGCVKSIIFCVSQESTPFHLIEHVSVCYAPCLRELSYLNGIGVCTVDGIPTPGLRIAVKPLGELPDKASVGQLAVTRTGTPQRALEIAAKWASDRTLVLLGCPLGVLWPVDYQFSIASELELLFSNSRYVNDIFLYCEPLKPIIAIVYPNRDTVEFEWQQAQTPTQSRQFGWNELVEYATDLIIQDLNAIGQEEKLHPFEIPASVHLHPHSFRTHATFLTPFGKIRRDNMIKYFEAVFHRHYQRTNHDAESFRDEGDDQSLPTEGDSPLSNPDSLTSMQLHVPFTIDIGGTFAKIAYVRPPNMRALLPASSSVIHEASSLSETLGLRTFRFFANEEAAKEELQQTPRSLVGTMCFAKIPSHLIPQFAEYLAVTHAVKIFRPEFMTKVRATGGGAFKYASLARNVVGVGFDVVKEMDAVVKGLNLIIQLSPGSIFTVEPGTGKHLPHKLVSTGEAFSPFPYLLINMGSGISFIKCLNAEGAHVRVGGSPIGGATFWGLTRTMTDLTSWEEVIEIMRLDGPGDNKNVDLLVGDIYGYNAKDLPAMLSSETVASSFGKFGTERFYDGVRNSPEERFAGESPEEVLSPLAEDSWRQFHDSCWDDKKASSIDIVRSLLNMIAANVTQLAYLHSKIHGVKNIFFAGGFVRNNPIVWSLISTTLKYWSSGECHAHFLEHDGYLGALGCATIDCVDE